MTVHLLTGEVVHNPTSINHQDALAKVAKEILVVVDQQDGDIVGGGMSQELGDVPSAAHVDSLYRAFGDD